MKKIKILAIFLCLLTVFSLCGCDASLKKSIIGSWQSEEGYIFTFDAEYLTVTAPDGNPATEAPLEYEAKNGILTVKVGQSVLDVFYYTLYADGLRLEYTEPVLEYFGDEMTAEYKDEIIVLERISG